MRVVLAAAMIMLLAGTAVAQQRPVPGYREKDAEKTPSEIAADKAAERAYKKSLGNIPDQGPVDPWGVVRSSDAPPKQPGAKAVKTKGKATTNN